jgi:hypothetical protein
VSCGKQEISKQNVEIAAPAFGGLAMTFSTDSSAPLPSFPACTPLSAVADSKGGNTGTGAKARTGATLGMTVVYAARPERCLHLSFYFVNYHLYVLLAVAYASLAVFASAQVGWIELFALDDSVLSRGLK